MAPPLTVPFYPVIHTDKDWEERRLADDERLKHYCTNWCLFAELEEDNTLPEKEKTFSDKIREYKKSLAGLYFCYLQTIFRRDFALEKLYEVFRESSEADWDGYDSVPISHEAYSEAKRFLSMLPSSLPLPDISAEPDGEIELEWYKGENFVFSVSVGKGTAIAYAGLFGKNSETHGTEHFTDSVPETVLHNLRRLFLPTE